MLITWPGISGSVMPVTELRTISMLSKTVFETTHDAFDFILTYILLSPTANIVGSNVHVFCALSACTMTVKPLSFAKVYNGAVPPPAAFTAVTITGVARLVTLVILADTFTLASTAILILNSSAAVLLAVMLLYST